MQLTRREKAKRRAQLRAAALAVLTLSAPEISRAESRAPGWHLEAATLLYAERSRTTVFEPVVSARRTFRNGHSLAGQFVFDAMTGASPSGAMPSGAAQTITTPSGRVQTIHDGSVPLKNFKDHRISVDGSYDLPVTRLLALSVGGHGSQETDYRSKGYKASLALDTPSRLNTIEVGGSQNFDEIDPNGGRPTPLNYNSVKPTLGQTTKRAWSALVGYTRVMSRRWLLKANYSREQDEGYLTEPYKVVSVINARTGSTVDYRWESRPDRRMRQAALLSSVYSVDERNVVHFEGRYYWDDWGLKSETGDVKWRLELDDTKFVQAHARFYHQGQADFFTYGLPDGSPLPSFATSDYRLGAMNSITIGAKYGVHMEGTGEFDVRIEYMRQMGDGHPKNAVGVQKDIDLMPAVDIVTIHLGVAIDR